MRKKFLTTISAVTLTLSIILGTSSTSYANSPALYIFDNAWNNRGSCEVTIDNIKPENLTNVEIEGQTLKTTDYSTSTGKNGTKLIINETALKNCTLKTGANYLSATATNNYETYMGAYILKDNESEITITKTTGLRKILKITTDYVKSKNETEVATDNYTIEETPDAYIIKFSDSYLSSVKDKHFNVYVNIDSIIFLELIKGEMGDVNCNEKIDIEDTKIALQATLGIIEETTEIKQLGDMDGDGKLSLTDTASVLKTALAIK